MTNLYFFFNNIYWNKNIELFIIKYIITVTIQFEIFQKYYIYPKRLLLIFIDDI